MITTGLQLFQPLWADQMPGASVACQAAESESQQQHAKLAFALICMKA